MTLKPKVKFGNHVIAMCCMVVAVNDVFKRYGYGCVITSFNDGTHGKGTLHYMDKAADFRTKHIPSSSEKQNIITEIKAALTSDFDVVFEGIGTENEHLHIEYDKK